MRVVNQPVRKVDAMQLVTGKPLYTDDLAPKDCLIIKILRSPHANAIITDIQTAAALKVPGIEAVFTYKDVPQERFTIAGQTYPEMSPHDHLILDPHVRYVGDAVAIVAGETEAAVDKAMKLIKVKYDVLEPVLDFRKAKDNPILVHPEENWHTLVECGGDPKRNLVYQEVTEDGDLEAAFASCDYILEETYHTQANQQAMMETFRAFCYMDAYGRLNCVAATQITFHVRRILSHALQIPKNKVRVIKPRIGGGFGAKQTAVVEVYPAFVTWMTGKPSKIVYSRYESQIASSPRHEMEIHVKVGATKDGIIQAINIDTLSNTGAFGEHGPTTVGLSGHKSIPLYGKTKAFRFGAEVVYTNTMDAGAYRGYGATQGIFALESAVNELCHKMNRDPAKIRELNIVKEGVRMPAYYNELNESCALDRCLARCKEMMHWDEKYPCRDMGNGKVRAVGVSLAMQGSSISNVDTAGVNIRLTDDGTYNLMIGASDMGTGCDTILTQIAAECLDCEMKDISVHGVDTDVSPYDSGSYASSTTYLTGQATVQACQELRKKMIDRAASHMEIEPENVDFDGKMFYQTNGDKTLSLCDLGNLAQGMNDDGPLLAASQHSSKSSPPPYMVGMAEIELDKETGKIELIEFDAVVDCGTPINPNLARIQVEGGLVQGIGMTMFENVVYNERGQCLSNSFMQYKIPTRMDVRNINVEFESSYEPKGPFGAKSIGEIVINTPSGAITDAIYNACGVRIRELPATSEKIYNGMQELVQ